MVHGDAANFAVQVREGSWIILLNVLVVKDFFYVLFRMVYVVGCEELGVVVCLLELRGRLVRYGLRFLLLPHQVSPKVLT